LPSWRHLIQTNAYISTYSLVYRALGRLIEMSMINLVGWMWHQGVGIGMLLRESDHNIIIAICLPIFLCNMSLACVAYNTVIYIILSIIKSIYWRSLFEIWIYNDLHKYNTWLSLDEWSNKYGILHNIMYKLYFVEKLFLLIVVGSN